MRYFTSDWHLNSNNILKYAKRPFDCASVAANKLVDNCNSLAKTKQDVVFHVGDFWKKGVDRHDKKLGADEAQLPACPEDYIEDFINARFVLLAGNHDDGHNVEADMKTMVIDLNQNWRNVTVGHYPSYAKEYHGFKGSEQHPHVHLCGHVHDKWLVYWDEKNHVLNVNVGCDVWDYKPVRDAELTEMLDYLWNGKVQAPDQMDREMFETWKLANEKHLEAERIFKKHARYAKKGLTPEECQRRKEAAMKAKGLI